MEDNLVVITFTYIEYLTITKPILSVLCSVEWNHFSNFGTEPQEEHFCEIIFKSSHQHEMRCHLEIYFYF